jgi:hypothetical protein
MTATSHDREATHRIVTDADVAEMRYPGSTRQTWPEDDAILALLDTREELMGALTAVLDYADPNEAAVYKSRALLARLRGEA